MVTPQRDPIDERIDRLTENVNQLREESQQFRKELREEIKSIADSVRQLRKRSIDFNAQFSYDHSHQAIVNLIFSILTSAMISIFFTSILNS